MNKVLILMRHAKAEDGSYLVKDHHRALAKKGEIDANRMGASLKNNDLEIDLLVSSSSLRTKTTAEIVAAKFPNLNVDCIDQLYNASQDTLLDFVSTIGENINTLMVVAHNNGISDFADYLVEKRVTYFSTATFVILQLKVDRWEDLTENSCILKNYYSPKSYE